MKSFYLRLILTTVSCASLSSEPVVEKEKINDQVQNAADVEFYGTTPDTVITQQSSKGSGTKEILKGSVFRAAKVAGAARSKRPKEFIKRNNQNEYLAKKGYKVYGWK